MLPSTRSTNPRTKVERHAARNHREVKRAIGVDILARRDDAGVSLSWLAREAGISKGHLFAIEAGDTEASILVLARIAAALGGRLAVRIDQGTGPVVRDHIQAPMVEAVLGALHSRWKRFSEVAVQRPVAGVIDLVLLDPDEPIILASEVHSELRRIEQQVRWSKAKADALSTGGADELASVLALAGDTQPEVSRLLLLRSTQATRTVVATFHELISSAYPASHEEAYAALTGVRPWPGPALLWMDVRGDTATLCSTPPRGIRLGR